MADDAMRKLIESCPPEAIDAVDALLTFAEAMQDSDVATTHLRNLLNAAIEPGGEDRLLVCLVMAIEAAKSLVELRSVDRSIGD